MFKSWEIIARPKNVAFVGFADVAQKWRMMNIDQYLWLDCFKQPLMTILVQILCS